MIQVWGKRLGIAKKLFKPVISELVAPSQTSVMDNCIDLTSTY